jgi:demethylmenaquinone methyltransferase/2-methoxy-6-polyprenyl-1,4-benzoquinol methylase
MVSETEKNKRVQVRKMFARIAKRYDLLNSLMTFGQDRSWRKELIEGVHLNSGERLLDVGAGSGDLAFEARRQAEYSTVVACDFTPEMITVGRKRPEANEILWVLADAENLPFKDSTFDVVVSGFLLRNVSDVGIALAEQHRTLRERGRLGALDTTPPESVFLRPLLRFHFYRVIPTLGRLFAGDVDAYLYLPTSTEAFLSAGALARKMKEKGFRGIGYAKRMLGAIALHWAYK